MGNGRWSKRWMRDGLHVDTRNRSTSFKPGSESSLGGVSALGLGSGIWVAGANAGGVAWRMTSTWKLVSQMVHIHPNLSAPSKVRRGGCPPKSSWGRGHPPKSSQRPMEGSRDPSPTNASTVETLIGTYLASILHGSPSTPLWRWHKALSLFLVSILGEESVRKEMRKKRECSCIAPCKKNSLKLLTLVGTCQNSKCEGRIGQGVSWGIEVMKMSLIWWSAEHGWHGDKSCG